MKTRGKIRNPKEAVYGALVALPFDVITVAASQANTTIQARLPLGLDTKIVRVVVVPGTGIANLTSFNVVVGAAAEGALVSDDQSDFGAAQPPSFNTNTTSGLKLFNADKAVTNTADLVQTFTPDVPEAVIGQGSELTLRIVSVAAAAGTLKVVCYGKFVDTKPTKPMANSSPSTLNLASDL